jgi:fructokinase
MGSESGAPVLVIGEALMDVIDDGATRTPIPGGSAANVALGLARRGFRVDFATHLSLDEHGRALVDHLTGSGVTVTPDSFAAERTSTAIARLGRSGEVDYRFDVAWRMPRIQWNQAARVIHVGSVPAFSNEGRAELLGTLRARTRVAVTFDPNIRPRLLPPRGLAIMRFTEMCQVASLVKLSDEDAGWLYPGQTLSAVAKEILGMGPRLVVVTMGAEGLLLQSDQSRLRVPAPAVVVQDTIGAGDTVMASLIADCLNGRMERLETMDLAQLGTAAVRAAAVTVTRTGADLPYSADL